MNIKQTVLSNGFLLSGLVAAVSILAILISIPKVARSTTVPGLSVLLQNGTNLHLTVTNGVSSDFYEIYSTNSLQSNTAWYLLYTGSLGQTTFVWQIAGETRRFFKARSGNDWDGDSIENWRDADPNNTNIGALFITIESPTNNAVLH